MKGISHRPRIARTAYVHPSAVLIGRVVVGSGVFIGPHAVIRADEPGPDGRVQPIVVGDGANVQDGVVIHALGGTGVRIGPRASISHAAVVHGPCKIGSGCFIGFNAVVFNAVLGDGVIVMHLALVEGVRVPAGHMVPPATVLCSKEAVRGLRRATPEAVGFARRVWRTNIGLAKRALERGQRK